MNPVTQLLIHLYCDLTVITIVFFAKNLSFLPATITFWDLSALSLLINSYFLIFCVLSCGGNSRCLNLAAVSSRLGGTWCPLYIPSSQFHCLATDHDATGARPLCLNVWASWCFFQNTAAVTLRSLVVAIKCSTCFSFHVLCLSQCFCLLLHYNT